MRILLDECVPRGLKRYIKGHEIQTVPEEGWAGRKNGELLELARDRFDLFLTVDQNLQFQQNLIQAPVAVLLLVVPDSSIDSMIPLLPEIEKSIAAIRPGEFRIVS
jgi:hypothetical protein